MTFTPDELGIMIAKMRRASDHFYRDAVHTGCHPFIEFTGLMNEYIKICEQALAQGVDFTETSIHGSGKPLPMQSFQRDYLNEKLECIYGHSLAALMEPSKAYRKVEP